jgi:hypothetical protein
LVKEFAELTRGESPGSRRLCRVIEFLRYTEGDRERISGLVEGGKAPAISNHAEQEELILSTVAA